MKRIKYHWAAAVTSTHRSRRRARWGGRRQTSGCISRASARRRRRRRRWTTGATSRVRRPNCDAGDRTLRGTHDSGPRQFLDNGRLDRSLNVPLDFARASNRVCVCVRPSVRPSVRSRFLLFCDNFFFFFTTVKFLKSNTVVIRYYGDKKKKTIFFRVMCVR